MRLALLLPVLFCVAVPAHAEGARESRYGPTTTRQASVAAAARYDGPMLSWANKREAPSQPVAAAPPPPAQPAPLAAWAGYSARPAPAAYTPPVAPTFAPPVAPRPAALPTSLYAAPRPSPVAVATPAPARPAPLRDRASYDRPSAPAAAQPAVNRPSPVVAATPGPAKDWSGYRSVRMATAASAPAATPVSAPAPTPGPPPPAPRQIAAANTGVTGARFYSVARESGLTPDPIPPAGPDHQVLITTDAPPSPTEDAAPMHGSADWLAAGARSDDEGDADDSAARRAKTRKPGL